jgi:hypothetical protein
VIICLVPGERDCCIIEILSDLYIIWEGTDIHLSLSQPEQEPKVSFYLFNSNLYLSRNFIVVLSRLWSFLSYVCS